MKIINYRIKYKDISTGSDSLQLHQTKCMNYLGYNSIGIIIFDKMKESLIFKKSNWDLKIHEQSNN